MNEKCKYCDYISKCSRKCEYDSILFKVQRSFPKVVDKSYEQLQQENQQLQERIEYLERSIVRKEETITELEQEQVPYTNEYADKVDKENKKLNGAIQTYDILLKSNAEENKQLKDNWNKLKDYIVKEYYMYLPLEASTRSITILIDKMQELEKGSNSNVKD